MKRHHLALAMLLLGTASAAAEVPKVVATIKPIHSLVAAVMGELGSPTLIVKGAASPHTYSLKPSEAGAIEAADIVFWTGHGLEMFLADSLGTLAPDAVSVELSEAPGVQLLPVREGGMFEAHAEDAAEEHAGHADMDMHVFLDPEIAKAMVAEIASRLSAIDPENAATYAANAKAEAARLTTLTADLSAQLASIADKPVVVFHDAYQYFGKRFGLNIVGSITVNPENMPGADRIAEVRDKLRSLDTACVFAEPQFDPRLVDVLIEGSNAGKGVLDPEGANLPEGKTLYPALLKAMADSLVACLDR